MNLGTKNIRILYIEDDPGCARLVQKKLEKAGHAVDLAHDGESGLNMWEKGAYDILLVDQNMPVYNGMEVIRTLASKDILKPAIMLTGTGDEKTAVESMKSGAWDYIVKDADGGYLELLPSIINRAQKQQSLVEEKEKVVGALRESEKKYRILFEHASVGILVAQDLIFKFANSKAEELFGCSRQELASKQFLDFIYQEDRDLVAERHRKRCQGESLPTVYPFRIIHKHGDIKWVEINVVLFTWEERPATLCFLSDITERKTAEGNLKKSNSKLEQALAKLKETRVQMIHSEKLASIGQLAAGIAHEINNPAGFIDSNLNTFSDYHKDIERLIREYRKLVEHAESSANDDSENSFLSQISRIKSLEDKAGIDFILEDTQALIKESQEGSARIKKIVQDLKDFSHPGEKKLNYVDINENLDSTLNIVWNELKYKAEVTREYGNLPEARCYPQELNQVFMNLLVNAAQAIEKRGKIKIATRNLDGQVEIKISDTGKGIPKRYLSKIFDPFFTTKEVGKGTGLGLNIAFNIVKKHRGSIEVDTKKGKGTTFTIKIPVE